MATGPGKWEKEAMMDEAKKAGKTIKIPEGKKVAMAQALPTKSHMAMVELMNRGLLKHVISQNTDGIHRKSGIDKENITEVHGNRNLELCIKCGKDYMRDFTTGRRHKDHLTGRKCDNPACKGDLKDTI